MEKQPLVFDKEVQIVLKALDMFLPELFIEIKKRERFLAYMQGKYYL